MNAQRKAQCFYCEKEIEAAAALRIEEIYFYCSAVCVRSDGFVDGYDEAIDAMERQLEERRDLSERKAEALVVQAYGELESIVENLRAEHVDTTRTKIVEANRKGG